MHLHEGSRWELTVYGASREPALPAFLASAVGGGRAGPGDHTRSS